MVNCDCNYEHAREREKMYDATCVHVIAYTKYVHETHARFEWDFIHVSRLNKDSRLLASAQCARSKFLFQNSQNQDILIANTSF